jgi:hypothetical protein
MCLQDVKGEKVDLSNDGAHGVLTFAGQAGKAGEAQDYSLELRLQGEIVVADSKVSVSLRHIFCVLAKKEEGHWPRLTEAAGRTPTHIKVDWNKCVGVQCGRKASQADCVL